MQAEIDQSILRLQALLYQCFTYHALKHEAGAKDGLLAIGNVIGQEFVETELDVIGETLPAVLEKSQCRGIAFQQAMKLYLQDIRILGDIFDIYLGHACEGIFKTGTMIDDGVDIALALPCKFFQNGGIQHLLGSKMPVQDSRADVDSACYLIDRDAVKSLTSKKALSSR